VSVRQLRPGDGPALAAFVERLSALSRYRRFHSAVRRLTKQMIGYLTDIDHHDHEALVAVPPGTGGMIVGVARFIRDPAHPDTAEVAVVVAYSWQRRGLGRLLLRRLARRASDVGISSVTGDILAENHPMIGLARRLGARSMDNHGSTVTTAEVVLVPRPVRLMLDLSFDLIRTLVIPIIRLARTVSGRGLGAGGRGRTSGRSRRRPRRCGRTGPYRRRVRRSRRPADVAVAADRVGDSVNRRCCLVTRNGASRRGGRVSTGEAGVLIAVPGPFGSVFAVSSAGSRSGNGSAGARSGVRAMVAASVGTDPGTGWVSSSTRLRREVSSCEVDPVGGLSCHHG